MRSKIISMLLATALTASIVTGCGNTNAGTSADTAVSEEETANTEENTEQAADTEEKSDTTEGSDTAESTNTADDSATDNSQAEDTAKSEKALPASYKELIDSLHAGQSYAYAPICEGDDALLVTSYVFDDLEGHQATYEATIYVEKAGTVEKVTTVQSGGTAYPIVLADDNSLMLSMRNSVQKGYVNKETGKFVVTEESIIDYSAAEDGDYHNYKEGAEEISKDSALYDELSEKYQNSEVLNFEKAGMSADGTPQLSGAVYAAYKGDDLYNISHYIIFNSETEGSTETPDGISGVPFTYELNGEDIVFHFGSADDNSEAKFAWDNGAYPTITYTGENAPESEPISITCLGNEDPETFDAAKYYDNDNNLYMEVKSFDETTLTGDLYREEKIKEEYVDNAKESDIIYSVNGTPFTVVSFEDVNKEIKYGTDEEFKKDVVGQSRFDGFLVKCNDDDYYCALEKGEYDTEYKVVYMLNEGDIRKLIEENVTFKIKDDCEIFLSKFVNDGEFDNLEQEYIIGREFKGDNYPGWSADAKEYYLTKDMLVSVGVIDGELYNVVQKYLP